MDVQRIGLFLVREWFWLPVDCVFFADEYAKHVKDDYEDASIDSFIHNKYYNSKDA